MPEAGYKKRRVTWTKEEIESKIKEWTELYGHPPLSTEWHPGDCQRSATISLQRASAWQLRARRFEEGEWPWTGSVVKTYGRWNNAIEAAGLEPTLPVAVMLRDLRSVAPQELDGLMRIVRSAKNEHQRKLALMQVAEAALAWAASIPDTQ
jgi:hypothetical protein